MLYKLGELYKKTNKDEYATQVFKELAEDINLLKEEVKVAKDSNRITQWLDDYERYFILLLDSIPVSELARLCGLSRMQIYRLLKTKSKLAVFKEYQLKHSMLLQRCNILEKL